MTSLTRAVSSAFAAACLVAATSVVAAEPDFTPPDSVRFRKADIISEGTRMAAEIFEPAASEDEKLPTVILCHGWGGVARDLRPEAVAFAQAGYLAVAFDYRGWGASDARLVLAGSTPVGHTGDTFTAEVREVREVVDPLDQTADLQNAVHWVHGEPRCDTSRIGLWGSSYSGGHVAYVAARDPRIKAIVSQVPALDSRWVMLPGMREQTLTDATRRARGEIGYPEPGARQVRGLRGAPVRERMTNYAPVDDVRNAPQCAMLFILAENEEYVDNRENGLKAFEGAIGPKKVVTIRGIAHYGIYGEARPEAQRLAIEWFDEHLKRAAGAAPHVAPD